MLIWTAFTTGPLLDPGGPSPSINMLRSAARRRRRALPPGDDHDEQRLMRVTARIASWPTQCDLVAAR
jgi:hypothetical protein